MGVGVRQTGGPWRAIHCLPAPPCLQRAPRAPAPDQQGKPVAYTPFCDNNKEMDEFRCVCVCVCVV